MADHVLEAFAAWDEERAQLIAERDRLADLAKQLADAIIEDERSPTAAQADALLAYQREVDRG